MNIKIVIDEKEDRKFSSRINNNLILITSMNKYIFV